MKMEEIVMKIQKIVQLSLFVLIVSSDAVYGLARTITRSGAAAIYENSPRVRSRLSFVSNQKNATKSKKAAMYESPLTNKKNFKNYNKLDGGRLSSKGFRYMNKPAGALFGTAVVGGAGYVGWKHRQELERQADLRGQAVADYWEAQQLAIPKMSQLESDVHTCIEKFAPDLEAITLYNFYSNRYVLQDGLKSLLTILENADPAEKQKYPEAEGILRKFDIDKIISKVAWFKWGDLISEITNVKRLINMLPEKSRKVLVDALVGPVTGRILGI